jgi:hypothetical protein
LIDRERRDAYSSNENTSPALRTKGFDASNAISRICYESFPNVLGKHVTLAGDSLKPGGDDKLIARRKMKSFRAGEEGDSASPAAEDLPIAPTRQRARGRLAHCRIRLQSQCITGSLRSPGVATTWWPGDWARFGGVSPMFFGFDVFAVVFVAAFWTTDAFA